jgi:N-acetylglucosamine-6-sulfatase
MLENPGRPAIRRYWTLSPLPRRRAIAVLALVAVTAFTGMWLSRRSAEGISGRGETVARPRPNIILILTDDLDQNLGTLSYLPTLKAMLADQGMTFTNMFVSLATCCPSRSTILRGQYVHNHQILSDVAPDGGFEKFRTLGEEQSTVGTWLQPAGYRTGLMGKYLNGYPSAVAQTYVPPGWDEWDVPAAGNPYGEFDYTLNENGALVAYGSQPDDYLTDVLSGKAVTFIRQAVTDSRPFFLYMSTYAPHGPATPAPRYADAFPGATAPRLPSYNETDVSDKPAWVQAHPFLTPRVRRKMDAFYRARLQSMLAVQDLVERLIVTLEETDQLDNTYIFFTSDNGFHMGEHRLPSGKISAYEEDIRVPLLVRGPGVPAGSVRGDLVGTVDLGPTFGALAGAALPDFVDGRSLTPLMLGPGAAEAWRGALLVEQEVVYYAGQPSATSVADPRLLEPPDPFESAMAAMRVPAGRSLPAYSALRTQTYKYVVYSTGERELYALRADPYERTNIARSADPALIAQLDAWLAAFRQCQGAGCRTADLAPPN